jgi:hypothetical protein
VLHACSPRRRTRAEPAGDASSSAMGHAATSGAAQASAIATVRRGRACASRVHERQAPSSASSIASGRNPSPRNASPIPRPATAPPQRGRRRPAQAVEAEGDAR